MDFHFLLGRLVVPEPGFIVGPIARVFGVAIDFLYNVVTAVFPEPNSLGITIILVTVISRFMMMPLMLKSQRSMMKLRELKPELDKIKEKYGDTKDPEKRRKMQTEQTALMTKHGANPLTGCLPMLFTMPIFIGLNFIIRQAFMYINRLNGIYRELCEKLLAVDGLLDGAGGPLGDLAHRFIPDRILSNNRALGEILAQDGIWHSFTEAQLAAARSGVGETLLMGRPDELARVVNRFNMDEWRGLFGHIERMDPAALEPISELVHRIQGIETFLGLHVVHPGGLSWPGVLIPALVLLTSFISSWLMQKRTFDPNADEKARMQQKIMLYAMPVVMAAVTISLPAGVGIFWITGQLFQATQDVIIFKKDGMKLFGEKPPPSAPESEREPRKRKS